MRILIPFLLWLPVLQAQQASELGPFLREHCAQCHGSEDPEAGLDLVRLAAAPLSAADAETWIELRDVLRSRTMPPHDEPQPTPTARDAAVAAVVGLLAELERAQPIDPGCVTMRRLSRIEYAATVHDLLGVDVDPSAFPADDLAYGFDNNGDALTLSPLHIEKYAAAAQRIADLALPDKDPEIPPLQRIEGGDLVSTFPDYARGEAAVLISNGTAGAVFRLPREGRYRVRVRASATQAGDELARMAIRLDGRAVESFDVEGTLANPGEFEVEALLGTRADVRAAFLNDYYEPTNPDPKRRDRNLIVLSIAVEGPLDQRAPTAAEIFFTPFEDARGTPRARAARAMRTFLRRAWRRPVRQAEVDRFARAVDKAVAAGEDFRAALRLVVAAALVSPHFLFRVEADSGATKGVRSLDDHALAVRLSYFLWSSMPDDLLFSAADARRLGTAPGLVDEARRMLDDARADSLATGFATQWLELRRLENLAPDPARFPDFDSSLAISMRGETELLCKEVLRDGLPLSSLLLADHTFVDARLARHYGFPAPEGDGFQRIALSNRRACGLLGHASILAVTSHPTRTSPVRRGKWVLDELLGAPPPAPIPGKDSFPPDAELDTPVQIREQLARHRALPECAVCHDRIDPLGLALERFDPLGIERRGDGTVDTRGRLPDGRTIDGAVELARLIAGDPAFARCVFRKLFVFALGREIMPADALALDRALLELPPDPPFREMVLAVIRLDAFRLRSPQKELR